MYTEFQLNYGMYELAGYKWNAEQPKALVVLLHGLGGVSDGYDAVAMQLKNAGYSVYAADFPGSGRSSGTRGHIGCSYEIVKIVDKMIIYAKTDCPDVPVFVMGYSLGGNIALSYRYYRRDIQEVSGYICCAPWLMLNNKWMAKHYKLAYFLSLVLPKLSVKKEGNPLSLQTAVDRERDARLVTIKAEEGKPVYLFSGDADSICLVEGARQFKTRAGNVCTYREWSGQDHDLLFSEKAQAVTESIIDWLNKML